MLFWKRKPRKNVVAKETGSGFNVTCLNDSKSEDWGWRDVMINNIYEYENNMQITKLLVCLTMKTVCCSRLLKQSYIFLKMQNCLTSNLGWFTPNIFLFSPPVQFECYGEAERFNPALNWVKYRDFGFTFDGHYSVTQSPTQLRSDWLKLYFSRKKCFHMCFFIFCLKLL